MSGTLILPEWLIIGGDRAPLRDWGVRVVDDTIQAVGLKEKLLQNYPGDEIWVADEKVLSPGFVDTHTHLYGILAHGIPLAKVPRGFRPFLQEFWWPRVEDRLDHRMIAAATDLQCSQMLGSGVTTFYDCVEAPNALPGVLTAQAEIVRRRGLRAVLSFEATERVSAENGQLGLNENEKFVVECRQKGGLVRGCMCFHTSFTCSSEFIAQAFSEARRLNTFVHMHCCESQYEVDFTLEKYGQTPIHHYDRLGVLSTDTLVSQCVQIEPSEIELMAHRGVRMSHMPLSNCEVGGGIAPVPELIEAGVTVGLGSDGYIDDFFEVMRGAFLIHKARRQDPAVMPANLVWHLATAGGAQALGLGKVGRIAPGWQADLQMIEARFPTPAENWNLFEQLVLYRNDTHVTDIMVAGRTLLRDGVLLDVEEDRQVCAVHEAARELWESAG